MNESPYKVLSSAPCQCFSCVFTALKHVAANLTKFYLHIIILLILLLFLCCVLLPESIALKYCGLFTLWITCPSSWWVSFSIKDKTKEHLNRTEGLSCQAYGVMIYLVRSCCQFVRIATCHLCWMRRCLWGELWTTFGDKVRTLMHTVQSWHNGCMQWQNLRGKK